MPRRFATALPVWVLALAGSVLAVWGNHVQPWAASLAMVLGFSMVLAFVIQLSTQRKKGLVNRLAFTTAGSLIIVGLAMIVSTLIHGVTILDWSWGGVG